MKQATKVTVSGQQSVLTCEYCGCGYFLPVVGLFFHWDQGIITVTFVANVTIFIDINAPLEIILCRCTGK